MEQEKDIITRLLGNLPISADRLNRSFESDAEILDYGPGKLLFSVDEFSAEDHFREGDPFVLGWNLAAGTISDILASGGDPLFYAHSLSLDKNWDAGYIDHFSAGIGDLLKKSGAAFIGGDTGTSETWHYTGIALGNSEKPITRKGAVPGDVLYMTGEIGAGNLEAGLKYYADKPVLGKLLRQYRTVLPLRLEESRLIRQYATACIDTSDGVLNAIMTLSEINNTGVEIERLPMIVAGLTVCKLLSKSKLCLFAAECGEYELLFSIPGRVEKDFLDKARKGRFKFQRLGKVTEGPAIYVKLDGRKLDFSDFNLSARSFESSGDYIETLEDYLRQKTKQPVSHG